MGYLFFEDMHGDYVYMYIEMAVSIHFYNVAEAHCYVWIHFLIGTIIEHNP